MANNTNYDGDTLLSEWYPIVKANFADIYGIAEEHKKDASNPHKVTKSQVGLGNVDNTSDKNKPVSNAVQAALDKKTDKTSFEKHTSDKTNPHGVNFNQVKSWADVKPLGNLRGEFKTHNNKDGVCYEYIGEETFGRASIVMFGVSESYPDYDFANVKINGVSYNIVDCKGNEVAYLDEDIVYVLMLSDEGTAYIIGHFGIKNGSITSAMLSTTLMSLIDGKAEKVHTHGSGDINDIDATPTKNSNYLVSSGGVYAALSGKAGTSHAHVSADITDKDTAPTENSGNLITSGGVYGALENMFSNDDYYFTDLNTITKPGAYGVYCESKDAASYNYPEGKSCGSLLVVSTVDGVNQIFVGQDNTFYTRLIETVSNECHEWKGLTDKINNELDKINNELFEIKEINFVNLSDFIKSSGSNYYDFSEKVGEDYFWVYNDFEEGISELYYNDDVKYVFTAEIGVGKYVKIKVEKNVVSDVDGNTNGEISVSPIQYDSPREYVSKKLDKEFNSNGYKNIDEITAALNNGLSGGTASGSHTHENKDILDGISGVDTAPTSGSDKLVTSGGVYTALGKKQATVTGGASTITSSNLTASRALVSNASGKVAVSAVTSTELGYLDGVTGNVQTQLDSKSDDGHTHTKADITDFPTALKNPNSLTLTMNGSSSTYNGESATSKSWYAPTSAGTSGYELVSSGGTPVWKAPSYAVCSTAAATAAKTASITNFKLVTGARVAIKFSNTNTASNPTLNISSTGAKTIKHKGFNIPRNYLFANNVYEFVYDGSYWQLMGDNECGTDIYNAAGGVYSSTINSANYPNIKSFKFAPMTYSGLTINCTSSCEFIGTGDIDNHYYTYSGASYDTKTKFVSPTISASASITFRNILFEVSSAHSIIKETTGNGDTRYQFIDCDFCISQADSNLPLFVLMNSSAEFINCRFYLNTSTAGHCYHIIDSTIGTVGTVTIKLINSIVNYSKTSSDDTVFATTNGGATKVIIENSYINNANPIKPTADFSDGFGISVKNSEFHDCNQIGTPTTYSSLTKGHFAVNNCHFTGTETPCIYASGNLVNITNNTFEKSPTVYLHGAYNVFGNNASDEAMYLYEYGKGTITGNTASSFSQSVSSSTYAKTGNYPTIS